MSVESPTQVQVLTDSATREIVAAVKRYRTDRETHAYVYLPDEVQHWRANNAGATTAGFDLIERVHNPLGVVPNRMLIAENEHASFGQLPGASLEWVQERGRGDLVPHQDVMRRSLKNGA